MIFNPYNFFGFILSIIAFGFFCYNFNTDPLFSILNILLGATCLLFIFMSSKNPYELQQIFYLANFIFLVLAMRIEKSLQILYWSSSLSVLDFYEQVTLSSILAMLCFKMFHEFGRRIHFGYKISFSLYENNTSVSGIALVVISLSSVIVIYATNSWSIEGVFLRDGGELLISSQTTWLIYQMFLYPMPSFCLVFYIVSGKKYQVTFLLLFLLVIIGNPPTGMARWQAAMLYGAIGLTGLPRIFSRQLMFASVQFFGLFMIFPLLDNFRRVSEDVTFQLSTSWVFAGHLDSAQNFARAMELNFITYGYQLLGVLLFFIPRSLWPSKPIGSGSEVSTASNLTLENISMHFLGEGYINFGFLGIFMFSALLGVFFGFLDKRFWARTASGSLLCVFYPFLLGWVFFFVRGDMLSSFAYMIGALCAAFFVVHTSMLATRIGFKSGKWS